MAAGGHKAPIALVIGGFQLSARLDDPCTAHHPAGRRGNAVVPGCPGRQDGRAHGSGRHLRDDQAPAQHISPNLQPRLAAGAWFIAIINGTFKRTDTPPAMRPVRSLTEVQLAVFILYSWADSLRR